MTGLLSFGIAAFSTLALSASAQAPETAGKPTFNVGDKWEFKQSTADGKIALRSREIVGTSADGELKIHVGQGQGFPDDVRLLSKFPFKVGDTWTFSRKILNLAKEIVDTRTATRDSGRSAIVETSELVTFTPGK